MRVFKSLSGEKASGICINPITLYIRTAYAWLHKYDWKVIGVANVTLAVPEDLKKKMDSFAEINWSAVARRAFSEKISDLELLSKFTSESTITKEDALRLGAELSRKLAKRYVK